MRIVSPRRVLLGPALGILAVAAVLGMAVNATAESPLFFLAENGVTVRCPDAAVNATGTVVLGDGSEVEFTKRDRAGIQANLSAASTTCTSGITDMNHLLNVQSTFNEDISSWDTSSVTNMLGMFNAARAFNGDIGNWDTSSVTNMVVMFRSAEAFDRDISGWDTSSVVTMDRMFNQAFAFDQDISSWDTSSVSNMNQMFDHASAFSHDLSGWCVPLIATAPANFAFKSSMTQLPEWGTCEQPLAGALVPSFGVPEATADGFRVQVSNYDGSFVWAGAVTSGVVAIDGSGLVTVTELAPGTAVTLTVTTSRSGYEGGVAEVTGTSMTPPEDPDAPVTPADDADASDDLARAVSLASAAAVGVAGTSSAVLVRGNQVVPVDSVLVPGTGQRGGVTMTAEGLRVVVASNGGAGTSSGVVVSTDAVLEVSIESLLVPGSVVEVWGLSTPRLLGAVRVPDGFTQGDTLAFSFRTDEPLDGRGRIGEGAHTLQLRMHATSGFEVLATGITMGLEVPTSDFRSGPVPSSVPAGEGPPPLWPAIVVMVLFGGGLRAAAVASRVPGFPRS